MVRSKSMLVVPVAGASGTDDVKKVISLETQSAKGRNDKPAEQFASSSSGFYENLPQSSSNVEHETEVSQASTVPIVPSPCIAKWTSLDRSG